MVSHFYGMIELAAASNEVDVRLLDKRGEDYVAPFVAFGGAGATLGRSTSGGAIFSPATLGNVSMPASAGEETTVQVRTLDGKRLKLRYDKITLDEPSFY